MLYKENWLTWNYDGGSDYGPKLTPQSKFSLKFKPIIQNQVGTYYQELLNNGRLVRDSFNEPFDFMFSGGLDSEVVLRVYKDLHIPLNVFMFKYKNNYNYVEYSHGIKVCEALNITPTIIDFDLEKFFEEEAYTYWGRAYFLNSGRIPHMKMIEYMDNIPVFGDGNPEWRKNADSTWFMKMTEIDNQWPMYCVNVGRTAIVNWYEYSPEVLVAYSNEELILDLLSNKTNEVDNTRIKYAVHQKYWPDIVTRKKLVGYEGLMSAGKLQSKPKFMLDFNKQYIENQVSNTEYHYSKEEFINFVTR